MLYLAVISALGMKLHSENCNRHYFASFPESKIISFKNIALVFNRYLYKITLNNPMFT